MKSVRHENDNRQGWLVTGSAVRLLRWTFVAALAALAGADLLIPHHPHFGIDGTFGFAAWFGFLSCVVLVLAAKLLGVLLQRPESYYDH